jgi:hypothetical protein
MDGLEIIKPTKHSTQGADGFIITTQNSLVSAYKDAVAVKLMAP